MPESFVFEKKREGECIALAMAMGLDGPWGWRWCWPIHESNQSVAARGVTDPQASTGVPGKGPGTTCSFWLRKFSVVPCSIMLLRCSAVMIWRTPFLSAGSACLDQAPVGMTLGSRALLFAVAALCWELGKVLGMLSSPY